ncbi:class I SAM-dependent methyltransferase [Methylocapsa acidiphila]|uniref:class I SAM-dependent methyltransferase n=1 Tax=Methylocapsa acidiphila TaxID=133552 RepID=UPI0004152B28|nr:SAM-dependent methyltransferase [Methylocapsa acidiphila]
MNLLESLIHEIIAQDGPISLERYMTLALAHPELGYYRSRQPFGAEGDFITAPEISQMFGELIGLWSVEIWRGMGAPNPVRFVELGPGRGVLMADALRAARVAPDFLQAIDLRFVETSEPLREVQRLALAGSGVAVAWHARVEEVPAGPAIFVANEFFDALPVRHYVCAEGGWRERLVGLDCEGKLGFGLAPEPELKLAAAGERGEILELGVAAIELMSALALRIASQGGALLALDYGYDAPARGETLQALRRHRFADPLRDPGEADLTTHVDFRALSLAAAAAGAQPHGPVAQGEFLRRLGIFERAAALRRKADARQSAGIDSALERLAGGSGAPTDMANLFKALAVTPRSFPAPAGFETGQA